MKNSKTKFTKRKSKHKLKRRWLGPGAAVTMPGGADNKCPICLEEFSQSEIDSNQTIQCNGCSQHFHENCIREWCESNITNRLCPICREPNICTNNDFNLDQPEPEPSQISDIITSLGLEHRRLQIINDTQLAEENTRFNALDSYDQMTIWVLDHLEEFINNINNSETNHDDEWVNETANNREENARIFREEVQRATFNRDLPVWFIAPRPEDSLDIQHLRDLYQLIVFTYNEYDRLKTEYPEYSYFELLFSSEKRNIHYKRAAAKRKLEDLELRTFTYSMILITKDTFSREANIVGGAKQADFLINLHKLLTNQEYSNIISWTFDNDGNILILLKDKLLVAKEVCPRSANIDFHSCARQFCNYGFKTVSRKKIQRIGENELVFSNPKVKSIDDILTLERKISTKCRKSPTIDDGDREANVLAQLNNPSPQSTDMDNNEAANVLASIANISDENTEDLDRRTSYLQNLNTNNEHSLKIALLIESLKNHVIDENEKNQINQKQNELWQSLKEVDLDDKKRKDILYQYMFEYLKRTIPISKLKEGTKIAKSNFESIKRAKIHNRPTEPLTESEQKQADEEMNASISRGQMLAQDEDTNMEDVQSPNTQFVEEPWWKKSGITDKALLRLHSEPVDGHMIEVWSLDHWKLGRAVRKKGRSQVVLKPLGAPGPGQANTIRQIVTQVDYIDGTSVDELLHRGDWKQRQNPVMKGSEEPKYWRYAKSNSRSQSGGVIYVDDEIIGSYKS